MSQGEFDPLAIPAQVGSFKRMSFIGSMQTVIGQVVKMVIQIASQIVLARLLFPADFGVLAMAYPVVALVGLLNDIGIGEAIIQKEKVNQQQVSTLFWASIGISILLALAVVGIAPLAALAYGDPRVSPLLMVLAIALPLGALGGLPSSILARQMRFWVLVRIEITVAIVGFVVTLGSAYAGASYWSLVIGQIAATITGGALGWIACRWRPHRPGDFKGVSDHLKFGANLTGANLANFVSTSADNVIIGFSSGPVSLGLYDRSYRLVVQPISQLLSPVSRVALPLLSRYLGDPAQYRETYLDMVRMLNLATVPLMIMCIVAGQAIVDLLLGARWTAAGPIFSWIAVGGLTAALNSSAGWLFVSQGRTASLRRFTMVSATIHAASFLIGSLFGILYIAAIAAIAFTCVTTPLMLYGATRHKLVSFRDILWTCAVSLPPAAAAAAACYAIGLLKLGLLVTLVASGLSAYAIFIAFFFAVPAQRKLGLRILEEVRSIYHDRRKRGEPMVDPGA